MIPNVRAAPEHFGRSTFIKGAVFDRFRCHVGVGDMWPITWADDGHLYGAAGDNSGSPMNVWRIVGAGPAEGGPTGWGIHSELVHPLPVDPKRYCRRPGVDPKRGVKPAGILCLDGVLYLAAELHNYGDNPAFNRQRNVSAWILASTDHGRTWDLDATPQDFFTGRLASPHFLQFGRDGAGARDGFVYACFPAADDGSSYWENGDCILLGRVPRARLLERASWTFYVGADAAGALRWSPDDARAEPVFRYPRMTGENHVSYNAGLRRYLMGNYGFYDERGEPRPYHQPGAWPESAMRSELTLFEAPEPWGPWRLFHHEPNWGTYGDYQPAFPTKWMSPDGCALFMTSSGSYDDYNLTIQKVALRLADA